MSQPPVARWRAIDTPTGAFAVRLHAGGALTTTWLDGDEAWTSPARRDETLAEDLVRRLRRAFEGGDADFTDVPTPPGPPFFRRCWDACRRIARGRTLTYAALAEAAGRDARAARAAGQAMRRNPLPIVIPCHRVLAAGAGLGGFSGSADPNSPALARKRRLLELEGALPRVDNGVETLPWAIMGGLSGDGGSRTPCD